MDDGPFQQIMARVQLLINSGQNNQIGSKVLKIMNVAIGLRKVGFKEEDVNKVMGGNWLNFFDYSFGPVRKF